MRPIIGNVGVAAPMDVVPISSKAIVSSPTSGSYRQHLGEPLVRPAGIIKSSSAAVAADDDDDCAAGKKRRRAATAGAVPSEIAAATSIQAMIWPPKIVPIWFVWLGSTISVICTWDSLTGFPDFFVCMLLL